MGAVRGRGPLQRGVLAACGAVALAGCGGGAPPVDPSASRTTVTAARSPGVDAGASQGTPSSSQSTPGCAGTACVSITLTGDVLLHAQLWGQARRDAAVTGSRSAFDFRPLLAQQRPLVTSTDLAFCHLETPVGTSGGPFHGYPLFTVPPQVLPALRHTGYDACTTASNHTLDAGTSGLDRTLDALDRAGLRHVGSARSAEEARRPALFQVRGTRLALLSYTYGLNGTAPSPKERWRVNLIDPARILRDAAAARRGGADLVVVALHWGTEYVAQPTAAQRQVAQRLLANDDIDLLYGHHGHVVQPVQRVRGRWVVYGLGNAVASQATVGPPTEQGLLVQVTFVRTASGRWTSPTLRWVPSFVTRRPYRWVDLRRKGSGHQDARRRIAQVVLSRGAAAAGAAELPVGAG